MVTTAHADWDARIRSLRHHGMSVPAHVRHDASRVIFERYDEPGYNFRLTDLQAAIGREQLARLAGMVARRRALAARYTAAFAGHPRIAPPAEPTWARSNWQSYCVRLDEALDQHKVMQRLLDRGVATRRGVMCAHREPAWQMPGAWRCVGPCGRDGQPPDDAASGPQLRCSAGRCRVLVESERAQDHAIVIPLSPQMTDAEQDHVIASLDDCAR